MKMSLLGNDKASIFPSNSYKDMPEVNIKKAEGGYIIKCGNMGDMYVAKDLTEAIKKASDYLEDKTDKKDSKSEEKDDE